MADRIDNTGNALADLRARQLAQFSQAARDAERAPSVPLPPVPVSKHAYRKRGPARAK